MARFHRLVGAAFACLVLAGCTLDSFTLSALGTIKGDDGPVVAGSLEVTTASTQKALSDMGLFVSVNRKNDTARLTSTTAAGKRFTLLLKSRKTEYGDKTQVSIKWEKDADEAFWLKLAGILIKPGENATLPAPEAPPR